MRLSRTNVIIKYLRKIIEYMVGSYLPFRLATTNSLTEQTQETEWMRFCLQLRSSARQCYTDKWLSFQNIMDQSITI